MSKFVSKPVEIMYTVFITLEPYLAQWLIHQTGGQQLIRMKKGSVENAVLQLLVTKPPKDKDWRPQLKPEPGQVEIVLPYNHFKNIRYNFYLPKKAELLLHQILRNRFKVQLWNDLHKVSNVNKQKDGIISKWMEDHGIEDNDKNWNTIAKILQRTKKIYKNSTT